MVQQDMKSKHLVLQTHTPADFDHNFLIFWIMSFNSNPTFMIHLTSFDYNIHMGNTQQFHKVLIFSTPGPWSLHRESTMPGGTNRPPGEANCF